MPIINSIEFKISVFFFNNLLEQDQKNYLYDYFVGIKIQVYIQMCARQTVCTSPTHIFFINA